MSCFVETIGTKAEDTEFTKELRRRESAHPPAGQGWNQIFGISASKNDKENKKIPLNRKQSPKEVNNYPGICSIYLHHFTCVA